MAFSSKFWTTQLERDFHSSVAQLRKLTETPSTSVYYRNVPIATSTIHTLSVQDELQIANSLAFLSHWDEGVDTVSSITLKEHGIGVTVCLASNSTPELRVTEGLREIAAILSEYARISTKHAKEKRRQHFYQELLDRVMKLDEKRILKRIKPPWVRQPRYYGDKTKPFLADQLRKSIITARQQLNRNPEAKHILQQLGELQQTIESIRESPDSNTRISVIEAVVTKCAEVVAIGSNKSIERYLKTLGASPKLCDASEIQQIDKLARYSFICKDLLRIARKPEYTDLLRHICINPLGAPEGCSRNGALRKCFVHTEMQQVMHYEKQPHWPPPRVIGCSKSACFLCDLFISTQGRYRVSHSHRRLYDIWTMPDVDWMTKTQVQAFRTILRRMVSDLKELIRKHTKTKPLFQAFPLESRAFPPLSGASTESGLIMKYAFNSASSKETLHGEVSHSSTSVLITRNDLPFRRYVPAKQPVLSIQLGTLSLLFESTKISNMQLTINQADMSSRPGLKTFEASQISTDDEVEITNSISDARVAFRLQADAFSVDIDLLWIS